MSLIVNYFNLVFGNGDKSKKYWETELKQLLQRRYRYSNRSIGVYPDSHTLSEEERTYSFEKLRSFLHWNMLFLRVCSIVGVKFKSSLLERANMDPTILSSTQSPLMNGDFE